MEREESEIDSEEADVQCVHREIDALQESLGKTVFGRMEALSPDLTTAITDLKRDMGAQLDLLDRKLQISNEAALHKLLSIKLKESHKTMLTVATKEEIDALQTSIETQL